MKNSSQKKRIQSYLPSESYDIQTHFSLNKPTPPFAAEFATYGNAPEGFRSPSNSTHQSFSTSPSPQSVFNNPFKPGSHSYEHHHNFLENSPTDKYAQDTPKFPNENGLSAYINKVWEEKGNLQEILDQEYPKPHHVKQYPSFDTTFIPLQGPNFDLNSIKPGMVSPKLAEALGMNSERDAPPYISNLSKIELPSYYRAETFYGINTPVPQNYNLESWENAGIKPQFLPSGSSQNSQVIHDDPAPGRNSMPLESSQSKEDEQYLEKFLRKPQNYYIQNNIYYKVSAADQKPIQID